MTADPALADATRLVARTGVLLVALASVAALTAGLLVGPGAAASAAIGIGLVGVCFGVSAMLLRRSIASGSDAIGLLLGGLGARVVIYLVVLDAMSRTGWAHGTSLALATGGGVVVTLTAELLWLHRSPHLYTVDPEARHPLATSPANPELTL